MRVLGIETSCDETAAAVVVREGAGRGRIVSNVVRAQWEQHRPFGGVVPELAARAHVECLDEIIEEAMKTADDPRSVADVIVKAATAAKPKKRYTAGRSEERRVGKECCR